VDVIEYFFKTMEKEGLYKGRIDFGNKEYFFSITDGVSKIDVKEKEAPAADKKVTIEREPSPVSDDRSFYVTRSDEKPRKSSSFKFIFFILIFVAITVLLVVGIPYLSKTSSNGNQDEASWLMAKKVNTIEAYRGYLADFPSGKYSLESRNRIEQFLSQGSGEEDFQRYYTQANDFFVNGELDKAFTALESAKKIKTDENIIELEKKINEKLALQSQEEKYEIYVKLAEETFAKEDYNMALHHLSLAKDIKITEQTGELEQQINEKIKALEEEKKFSEYIKLAETALENKDTQKANKNLLLAKNIKDNQQVSDLENRIKLLKNELLQKENEGKRDDVYNRYLNFSKNYFQEGQYSKALSQVRKAQKIKNTTDAQNLENQIKAKINASKKISQAQIREDNFQKYLNSARKDFDKGKHDQALNNIKKAREIKSSSELDSLEKEILRVKKGIEDEKLAIEEAKKRKEKTAEYNKYKTRAEGFYKRGEFNKALYNVNRAKKLINTSEIRDLEKKIQAKKKQLTAVKSVNLMSLPPSMINQYNAKIKKIDVFNIPRGIKTLGQISMSLAINPDGRLTIQSINDKGLQVRPPRSHLMVKGRIIRAINSIILSPPINRNGDPVRVQNWRVSYNVGTFMGKIILRRRF
jgi:tetratricopeptide (TPR) repeat protein